MKNVEAQLEKHQKAITALITDHKVTPGPNTPNEYVSKVFDSTSPISEESTLYCQHCCLNCY